MNNYPGYPTQNHPIPPLPDLPNSSQAPNAWSPSTPAMGFTQQYPPIPALPHQAYPYSPYPPQGPYGLPYPTSPLANPVHPPVSSSSLTEFPPLPPVESDPEPQIEPWFEPLDDVTEHSIPEPQIEPWFEPLDDVTEYSIPDEPEVQPEDDVAKLRDQFSDILNAYNDDIKNPTISTEPTPTIVPADPFDASADAAALRKAMKGLGTNERVFIDVLSRHTNRQRLEIAECYRTTFSKDLVKDIRSELSGKFLALVVAAMTSLPALYARELHDAMAGSGANSEVTLVELLCTLSNSQLRVVAEQYETMFKGGLEDAVRAHTVGLAQRVLLAVCAADRDEDVAVDVEAAEDEANQLLSGEDQLDEDTLMHVLARRSLPHVRHVLTQYEKTSGNLLEKVVQSKLTGSNQRIVLAVVKCVRSRAEFLAELVHASVAGLGTKDRTLIRLVVTRAELDLGDVKIAFQNKYGKSLAACVASDTTGDYKKMLLAMIG